MAEDPGSTIDQSSIDDLLRQAGMASGTPASGPPPDPGAAPPAGPFPAASVPAAAAIDDQLVNDQASIDELLRQANFEDPMALGGSSAPADGSPPPPPLPDAARFELPSFQQVMQDAQASSIDLLRDVELNVKIELGRSRMLVEDVLKLAEGSVVELDKLAGDPVDVFVNDRLVARGEVLVLNDNFCVRVNEIVAGAKEEGL
jgi:flagellar motor switch protein FliN/FliY